MTASLAFGITTVYYLFHNYLVSGYLFLPTVIWVAFATYLQLEILVNNRQGYYDMNELMVYPDVSDTNQQTTSRLRAPPYLPSSQKSQNIMFEGNREF